MSYVLIHHYCTETNFCVLASFLHFCLVAFRIYDIDQDGFISNGELFQVLKTMVGNNLTEKQLQEIVDKTILYADKDGDGKISYEEFCDVSLNSSLHWYRVRAKLYRGGLIYVHTVNFFNVSCKWDIKKYRQFCAVT